MSGGGIGGTLGGLAGVALAPETGGLSLALPALMGAGGAFLGDKITGTGNPLQDALLGGIGGGLGGYFSGGQDVAGLFGGADAAGAAGAGATSTAADAAGIGASDMASPAAQQFAGGTGAVAPAAASGGTSMLGNVGNWASKNPLQAALLGETALSGVQALLPKPSVNIGQTAAQVKSTDPNWNATLPQYKMQNTATPYQGDWYTYGQRPQTAMYNAQPVPQAEGGLINHYAKGGTVSPGNRVNPLASVMPRLSNALKSNTPPMHGSRFPAVHGYAIGGNVMPVPIPPQGQPQPAPQGQPNPLQLAAAHKIGVAIGQHLRAHGYDPHKTPAGPVHGKGGGQDDAIPAKLSDGEYVHSADVVSALGDGSSKAGGEKLKAMDAAVRAHKTSHGSKFPPRAKKNPLDYIGGHA